MSDFDTARFERVPVLRRRARGRRNHNIVGRDKIVFEQVVQNGAAQLAGGAGDDQLGHGDRELDTQSRKILLACPSELSLVGYAKIALQSKVDQAQANATWGKRKEVPFHMYLAKGRFTEVS